MPTFLVLIFIIFTSFKNDIFRHNYIDHDEPVSLFVSASLVPESEGIGLSVEPATFGSLRAENENLGVLSEDTSNLDYTSSTCQLSAVVHVLKHSGCKQKPIASSACSGSCPSYIQVSSSKFWLHERSCSCCQQTGLKENTFVLDCPALRPPYRLIRTYAPTGCLCRNCDDLSRENLQPQEILEVTEKKI